MITKKLLMKLRDLVIAQPKSVDELIAVELPDKTQFAVTDVRYDSTTKTIMFVAE